MKNKAQIFLSYCWKDDKIANEIYDNLVGINDIDIHRDKIDIKPWNSIKAYMQSISDMDYTILLISDAYLKSENCMYEVLEMIKDHKYRNKIFPAVIDSGIYDPIQRIRYVKYWQDKYKKLKNETKEIDIQNLGTLPESLKKYQDIASNITTFIDSISDMNNPNISDITKVIIEKLTKHGFIGKQHTQRKSVDTKNIFEQLGISTQQKKKTFTDLEVNQFINKSFQHICQKLEAVCKQFESENQRYNVVIEYIDSRNFLVQFYMDGMNKTGVKISLDNIFGGPSIGLSTNMPPYSSGHSWNNIYSATNSDGKLMLKSTMSIFSSEKNLNTDDVVKDIWNHYIIIYL